jgi:hypothetical protein
LLQLRDLQSPLFPHAEPVLQFGEQAGELHKPAVQTCEPQSLFEPQDAP